MTPPPTPDLPPAAVDLSAYCNPPWHDKGRGFFVRAAWHCVNALFLQNTLNPSSTLKVALLRLFGARIGRDIPWESIDFMSMNQAAHGDR